MDLNWKEERVVGVLKKAARPLTIREIGARCFPGVRPVTKRDSQVRNSLRKPVREKRAAFFSAGTYKAGPRA
jgi:hypothetical protein